jgi:cobalt/nickel transport system permease protein
MNHSFIDKYSDLDSVIHRLDPRAKIVMMLFFVVAVVLTQATALYCFAGYAAAIIALIILSRLPLRYVLGRSLVIVPFAVMISVFGGIYTTFVPGLVIKSWLAIMAMIVLSATTRFPELLKGFEQLGMPRVIIMIISFMYRYIFILIDEVMRMQRSRDLRSFTVKPGLQIRTFAHIVSALFVRTYERGERVYTCMTARGFSGEIHTFDRLRYTARDAVFSGIFIAGIFALWMILK